MRRLVVALFAILLTSAPNSAQPAEWSSMFDSEKIVGSCNSGRDTFYECIGFWCVTGKIYFIYVKGYGEAERSLQVKVDGNRHHLLLNPDLKFSATTGHAVSVVLATKEIIASIARGHYVEIVAPDASAGGPLPISLKGSAKKIQLLVSECGK